MKGKDIEEKEERESESMKKSIKREGGSCFGEAEKFRVSYAK